MAYRWADRNDRWKAMLGAIAVTAILGAGILSGLNVKIVRQAVERLETFDISLPKPPPEEPPPPPTEQKQAAKEQAAPAAPKASPIVAPKPEVQLPTKQVIAAATQAGTGASSQNGQGGLGTGTGTGGTGSGRGGGGAGFTPAQKVTKIPNREYRQLVAVSGFERGTVGLSVRVTPEGRSTNCRIVRSSGSSRADSLMCELTERYIRFRPARDPSGRAVAQDVTWYPNWFRP